MSGVQLGGRTSPASSWMRPLGRTGLQVSAICAGGGPLGSMPENFGYDVTAERGVATVERVLAGPINFLDTSNGYSGGESERRIGMAVQRSGGLPDGFVLATKVDADEAGDFSGERVRRSVTESLERLHLDSVDLLYIHDPEVHLTVDQALSRDGAIPALLELQRQGIAKNLGVAGGPVPVMESYLHTGAFQVLLTHNRWTLIDRSAGPLIQTATDLGVGIVNAAVLGGGILGAGTAHTNRYAYRPAHPEVLRRIAAMETACAAHGVPLATAALQFSVRDDRIASTVVGFSRPERVEEIAGQAAADVPDELWAELESLVAPPRHWLDPPTAGG